MWHARRLHLSICAGSGRHVQSDGAQITLRGYGYYIIHVFGFKLSLLAIVLANDVSAEARHMYPTSRSANDSTCSETRALLSCKTRRRPDTFSGYQDWAVANASLAVCREVIGGRERTMGTFRGLDWEGMPVCSMAER